ncbi:MAG: ABC transporter substrate-binding protein [Sedimentisphaerales bacterium]|nr:ABC transporter substrate-binding protein [Sedimentisphaerales bacterium]
MIERFEERERMEAATRRVMGGLGLVILVLLASGWAAHAQERGPKGAKEQPGAQSAARVDDPNDPNELWWRRWDVSVKDPNDPNELLEVKWNAVLKVLQAQDMDQPVKEKIIDRIVSPVFDFPLMAQLALGRTHWPKLNPAQRERFTTLFVERLKALYLEKTTLYRNEKTVLKPGVRRRNTVQIPMMLLSEGQEIAMSYKLHKADGQSKDRSTARWRIYDVEIQGVSILLTYRSQFDDILRQGTVKDLLSQLEKPSGE